MTEAVQKITVSPSRDIPFDKLVLSQSNVRRINAGVSVEELAKDVGRHGLLPRLGVRDARSPILAEDDSLAENEQRVALHPLDQFRAFVSLRDKSQSDAEIAPALLEVYAEDGMTLEQLMAFTVTPNHARQVQVWDVINSSWAKEPFQIPRMLTETAVRVSDRRAVLVGVDTYEAAGGTMLHDLFQGDDGGWLKDPTLVDRLVTEQHQPEAETVAVEGWKWIEVALDLPYGYSHGLRRLSGDLAPMMDDEGAAHAKLLAEYRALEEEYVGQGETRRHRYAAWRVGSRDGKDRDPAVDLSSDR